MKKLIIIILFIFVSFISFGCKKNYYEFIDLSYGEHERQKLDLYIPHDLKDQEEVGLILYIHGGAWVWGDKSGYTDEIKKRLKNNNVAIATMNYRYASIDISANDIMNDIYHALDKIKAKANEKNIDITKVLLTGHSAGGHLSLLYAYGYQYFEPFTTPIMPVCVVSLSGPTDITNREYYNMSDFGMNLYELFSWLSGHSYNEETYEDAMLDLLNVSPIKYSHSAVPTLLCHGTKDSVVPYSDAVRLDYLLTEDNIDHHFLTFPNSNHGLESDPDMTKEMNKLFNEYIDKYLVK